MNNLTLEKDLSVPLDKIVLRTLWIALLPFLFLLPLGLIVGTAALRNAANTFFTIWVFLPVMLVGIFVHEAIHGITWAVFAKSGFRVIRFGVKWKSRLSPLRLNSLKMK